MKTTLQGIGIIFTLLGSFLGLMYTLKGDLIISSVVSLMIIVIEFFLIEKFIKSKSEITKNKFSTLSIVLWSLYVILAIPMSVFLLHALNVEINAKKEIQKVANTKITDLNNMVNVYRSTTERNLTTFSIDLNNKLTSYVATGNTELKTELTAPPYNISIVQLDQLTNDNIQVTTENIIKAKILKLNSITDTIEKSNKSFINQYGGVFDNWSRLQLNYAYYELDNLLANNKNALKEYFQKNLAMPIYPFDYEYKTYETNLNKPDVLFKQYKPYYLLLAVALFHLLILLPYMLEPVSGVYLPPGKGPNSVGRGGIEL